MQDLEEQTHDADAKPETAPEAGQDQSEIADTEALNAIHEAAPAEPSDDAVETEDSAPSADTEERREESAESVSNSDQPERGQEHGDVLPEAVEAEYDAEGFEAEYDLTDELSDAGEVYVAETVADGEESQDARHTIKAIIEAAIYITDEPLTADQIAAAVEQPVSVVKDLLAQLVSEYGQPGRGLTVRELAGGYKMGTKPEIHESIRAFVKRLQPPLKLSLAALETLAVVAYKQPITAPEIMEIRGVQGAGVLKTLLDRKLIATAGRKDVIGKPIMYKTTKEFLIQFGLSSLGELPTLKEFEELGRLALTDETPQEPEGPATPEQARAADAEAAAASEIETDAPASAETQETNEAVASAAPKGGGSSDREQESTSDADVPLSTESDGSTEPEKASNG
jgi:segregation and condensation protein B